MTLFWQVALTLAWLALWQWGWDLHERAPWAVPDMLDPYFVSRPSEIWQQFLRPSDLCVYELDTSSITVPVRVVNPWRTPRGMTTISFAFRTDVTPSKLSEISPCRM